MDKPKHEYGDADLLYNLESINLDNSSGAALATTLHNSHIPVGQSNFHTLPFIPFLQPNRDVDRYEIYSLFQHLHYILATTATTRGIHRHILANLRA